MKLHLGPEIIKSYRRLSYTLWTAIAEFVDNSTQSYFNNRANLDQEFSRSGAKLTVLVEYDSNDGGHLKISDNAMGMSLAELEHACSIAKPPADTSGRS